MNQTTHFFCVTASIIKNSELLTNEEYGVTTNENKPVSHYNILKEKLTAKFKNQYPNDSIAINVLTFNEISKDDYESKFGN